MMYIRADQLSQEALHAAANSVPSAAPAEPAEQDGAPSLLQEFRWFLVENKKWWLLPLIVMFLLMGALLYLGGTAVAPFIYTIFG
jgi:hypothetical protein